LLIFTETWQLTMQPAPNKALQPTATPSLRRRVG
jgi:hypothetical protein